MLQKVKGAKINLEQGAHAHQLERNTFYFPRLLLVSPNPRGRANGLRRVPRRSNNEA